MTSFKFHSFAIALGLAVAGCSSSSANETDAGNPGSASSGPATFTEVYAIITAGSEGDCTECHAGSEPSAGLDMGTQATAYTNLVGKPPTTTMLNMCAAVGASDGLELVKAGDAEHSLVYLKISETSPPCGVQMPQHRQPLTTAEIATFASWINAGAKDD